MTKTVRRLGLSRFHTVWFRVEDTLVATKEEGKELTVKRFTAGFYNEFEEGAEGGEAHAVYLEHRQFIS